MGNKSTTTISSNVAKSFDFKSMSLEAKFLYFELNVDACGAGYLKDPESTVDVHHLKRDALRELEDAGYVITTKENELFITHFWSVHTMRKWHANVLSKSSSIQRGLVCFDGAPFKSNYALARVGEMVSTEYAKGTNGLVLPVLRVIKEKSPFSPIYVDDGSAGRSVPAVTQVAVPQMAESAVDVNVSVTHFA